LDTPTRRKPQVRYRFRTILAEMLDMERLKEVVVRLLEFVAPPQVPAGRVPLGWVAKAVKGQLPLGLKRHSGLAAGGHRSALCAEPRAGPVLETLRTRTPETA
jgi:hypothetical protein